MFKSNIILIGMPGVGKSTVGVLLAKALGRNFIDTDVYIQAIENRTLQSILDEKGKEDFCKIEQEQIICIDVKNAVIATGGSVVYSQKAMDHLSIDGIIIHLDLDYKSIEKRITNLSTRGVVKEKHQTIKDLYETRQPIYLKYAQITINCTDKNQDQIVTEIIERLNDKD
ncbi:MAG TPA: shikimate kinase [Sedimentisphaerales bacterium]|nr:shikimate kinase [Sedimentisphaerales bacterium]